MSHGCVRLSVKNAAALWELVKQQKMANTTVVLTGAIRDAGPPAVARSRPMPLTPEEPLDAASVPLAADNPSYGAPSPQYQRRYEDNRQACSVHILVRALGARVTLSQRGRGSYSVRFKPDVHRVTGRTFKSALAEVRSNLDYPDKPHWFTARRTVRAVGDKHHSRSRQSQCGALQAPVAAQMARCQPLNG